VIAVAWQGMVKSLEKTGDDSHRHWASGETQAMKALRFRVLLRTVKHLISSIILYEDPKRFETLGKCMHLKLWPAGFKKTRIHILLDYRNHFLDSKRAVR
jgi:hypothetical protein